jgi:tripartite ATP-independent transporter DctM subunit
MNAGGMSRRIVNSALVWVGHFQGGLGYVAVFAAIIMASLSGSAVADTAALAAVLMPMMRKAGYRMDRSAGLIAAGGIIAPVIPPSIGFILFGVIGGVSISKLFMAGIFPGLLMGLALIITWWIVARHDKVEVSPRVPMGEKLRVTADAFWCYLMAVTIIGGMKFGIFTPTEAAVVAVVYSLLVGLFIYREIRLRDLYRITLNAAKTSSVVMFLVAAALVSAWLITVANIPAQMVQLMQPFIDNKMLLMAMLMLLVLVVGTALDFAPTVLILTPVLMPLVRQAGIDPVYFGVLFIINNAIGLLTPPVGTVLNVVCGVGRIPMHDVIKGVMPFLASQVVVMGLGRFFVAGAAVPEVMPGNDPRILEEPDRAVDGRDGDTRIRGVGPAVQFLNVGMVLGIRKHPGDHPALVGHAHALGDAEVRDTVQAGVSSTSE